MIRGLADGEVVSLLRTSLLGSRQAFVRDFSLSYVSSIAIFRRLFLLHVWMSSSEKVWPKCLGNGQLHHVEESLMSRCACFRTVVCPLSDQSLAVIAHAVNTCILG